MLLGHYAVALGAKKFAPKTSLGTLIAAAVFLDLVWPLLVLAGVETVSVTPGATAVTPLTFTFYPWSHSLLMSVVWGALFGGLYAVARRYRAGAIAIFVLVISHWLLDYFVHVPDLPLTPWGGGHYGLGLWHSLFATSAIEIAMFALGCAMYLDVAKARDTIGSVGFALFAVLLLIVYAAALLGPPPPNVKAIAWTGNAQWLFIALAAWIDAHRPTGRKFGI